MNLRNSIGAAAGLVALAPCVDAQQHLESVLASLDAKQAHYADVAQTIWGLAEVGFQEFASSELLQQELRSAGFEVTAGVAGMPTAFVAEHGAGQPVIGILAEFDALPGITQDAVPERRELPDRAAGHACGHHLFGTGSVAAAVAIKDWLELSGTAGTIRVYGTPAEEGGGGKVYMVREGLFADVDAVLHWHASDKNDASPVTTLANLSAKFRFRGVSSHAARAPERGRSALDGVEAMNYMVNLLREHVSDSTRIHYAITSGGAAPNVVPDFAESYYYARHPDPQELFAVFERILNAANGAALGTGTTVEHEIVNGVYSVLPNLTLASVMDRNLRRVGGVHYTPAEQAFAERLRESLPPDSPPLASAAEIRPFDRSGRVDPVSTDAGDVSWAVPTASLNTATWVPGTAAHSWQAVAAGGTSIGAKGMLVAAKTLARTAIELYVDADLLAAAKAEHAERIGADFEYRPLLGDRPPALDYR
ncbi:MAG TPA: amidohydrolase [Gammaproteobacteria bacterium]